MSNVGSEARPVTAGEWAHEGWAWSEALAMAEPGASYRVREILFSLVRERCAQLGCTEGETYVCTANSGGFVVLEGAHGRHVRIERRLAWFVQAELRSSAGRHPH